MTKKILSENMDKLENVAQALLVYETLDAEEFVKAIEGTLPLDVDLNEVEEAKKREAGAIDYKADFVEVKDETTEEENSKVAEVVEENNDDASDEVEEAKKREAGAIDYKADFVEVKDETTEEENSKVAEVVEENNDDASDKVEEKEENTSDEE